MGQINPANTIIKFSNCFELKQDLTTCSYMFCSKKYVNLKKKNYLSIILSHFLLLIFVLLVIEHIS